MYRSLLCSSVEEVAFNSRVLIRKVSIQSASLVRCASYRIIVESEMLRAGQLKTMHTKVRIRRAVLHIGDL